MFALALTGGVLALYAGYHVRLSRASMPRRDDRQYHTIEPANQYRDSVFWTATVTYAVLTALVIAQNAQRAGGLSDWLLGARGLVYGQTLETSDSAIIGVAMAAAHSSVLVFLYVALLQRRWLTAIGLYLLVLLGILGIFVTRLELVITLWLPFAYFHYHVRRLPTPAIAALSFVALVGLSLLNVWRGTGLEDAHSLLASLTAQDLASLSAFNKDINVLYPFSVLWELNEQGRLKLEYGLNYLFTLLTFVPRSLWPAKPVTSFENRYTVLTEGSLTGAGGGALVWTYTAWGEGLTQFGLVGVLLNLYIYGRILRACRDYASMRPELRLAWLYFTVLAATYLRASVQSLVVMSAVRLGGAGLALWLATRRRAFLDNDMPSSHT